MKVRFWGVRGSIPVPGPRTNRYGGNTSCVAVRSPGGTDVVLDAGTGLRKLGQELMQRGFGEGKGEAHLLISHTHWDHIQGLPFFAPLHKAGNQFCVYARERAGTPLRSVIATQYDDPYFAVPFDAVKADVDFRELGDGARFELGDVRVSSARLNHPWIATAYRLDSGPASSPASMVYATDTAPFRDILFGEAVAAPPASGAALPAVDVARLGELRASLIDLCRGAQVLVHDAQFTDAEYRERPHWGHSTPDDAIDIALAAGVKTLVLFHHAPERGDDELDLVLAAARARAAGSGLEVLAAHEGLEFDLAERA
ncbi:MAG: MBL fold metallo-hydrolase [Myxococcales bacterium]|nr:MBL fold metallo-hydrolase [Myxococcales bacterium]